jgi:dipeptidyl aminopeptidase/acylaminoacyl peptidase
MKMPVRFAVLASLAAVPLLAQNAQRPFDFSIANMMRGPELYGREPQRVQWSADNKYIYFYWNPPGTKWSAPAVPYRVRAQAGSAPERLTEAQVDSAGPLFANGSFSRDRRWKAAAYEGDLYVVDMRAGTSRRLTQTVENEGAPTITADGSTIYFTRANNIYSLHVSSTLIRQVTDVRNGPEPRDSTFAGQRGALRNDQTRLFDALRERARLDSMARADRRAHDARNPKPLYLNAGEQLGQLSISPSGSALLLTTNAPAPASRGVEVPAYVTQSGYTEPIRGRTKVGDEQGGGRMAFVPLAGGDVKWLRLNPADTNRVSQPIQGQLSGWSPNGDAALVIAVTRDFKTRYIHRVDATGALKTVDILRDSAWVLGGCGGTNACGTRAGWLDGDRVYFTSEADGFAHVYSTKSDGTDRKQLTSGKWEVLDVQLTPDRTTFYLSTSETSPFDAQLYRMSVNGGAREKLTAKPGAHATTMSPDGQWLADVYSFANKPPELYLVKTAAGADMAQLTTSPSADWQSFKWLIPEIVHIPASDGIRVPARIYKPADMNAQPNGAAVIFVHGAGYLHNIGNFWSPYPREYMFHHFLASKGYVVLDIDYRGSAGYGRDWRTAIYRWMGGRDLQDQVDGSRYLQKEFGINPERIGMYGGSYGGFMTLMALFTEPKQFGAGAALRSVTDWAHYNNGYTGQILNMPQTDTLSYRRSSPIFFAAGLEDPLLMAHGMVDVNVHFQDIVRLTQKLIELGKENWELAVYPVEDHGFVRPDSWTDEYTRIFKLFERTIAAGGSKAAAAGGKQ